MTLTWAFASRALVVAGLITLLGTTACSTSTSAGTPAAGSASPSTVATGAESPGATVNADGSHPFGSAAEVLFDDLSSKGAAKTAVTVSLERGTLADVKSIRDWGGSKPADSGWTPIYVTVDVKNISDRTIDAAALSGMTNLVNSDQTPLQQHTFEDGFDRCSAARPGKVKVGSSAKVCVVYELPDGQSVGRVNMLSGSELISWS